MYKSTYVIVRLEVLMKNKVRYLRKILHKQRNLYYYNYVNIRNLKKLANIEAKIYCYFATKRYKVYHLDLEYVLHCSIRKRNIDFRIII